MTAYSWTGVSGDWNVAANWSPSGGPPKSTDTATIGGTGTYSVTVDSADVAKSLTLSDANATLKDDGASASLTIGGPEKWTIQAEGSATTVAAERSEQSQISEKERL